jgi:ketosteroid isomerase-like protein
MTDHIDIARRCFQAYVDSDRSAIEALIADDFHFTSPLDNRLDREAYFERCWPNSEWISGFEFVRCMTDGAQVFVTYVGQSENGNRFRNSEVLTIRGGKISEVEVYFGWNIPHEAPPGGFVDPD